MAWFITSNGSNKGDSDTAQGETPVLYCNAQGKRRMASITNKQDSMSPSTERRIISVLEDEDIKELPDKHFKKILDLLQN